ncbi:MAG: hypothetical protein QW474_00960 [Candidatus Aenigmatarchaeota archaeon]|nr:hypothetical protein [Candidatus Aenigmarchaeota archaeon]
MKRIEIILLVCLLLLIFAKPIIKTLTGLATDIAKIFLSPAEKDDVCIAIFKSPETIVYQNDKINMSVEITNCGSTTVDIKEEIGITDEKGFYYAHFNASTYSFVKPGERKVFNFVWQMRNPGLTYIILKTYFADKYYQHNFTTLVLRPPEIQIERAPVNELVGVGQFAPGYNMKLEFNKEINITQDEDYILLIKVINFGDSDLHDVFIFLDSKDLEVKILYPEKIDRILPTQSVVFVSRIKAPSWLPEGNYTVKIEAVSYEKKVKDQINVNVKSLNLKEKVKELIAYYSDILKQLEREIDAVQNEKNVTIARQYLEEAKEELETAKDYFKLGWLKDALDQINVVKQKVDKVVIALSKAEPILKRIEIPAVNYNYLLWVLLAIILSLFIYIVYRKKKEKNELLPIKRWSF